MRVRMLVAMCFLAMLFGIATHELTHVIYAYSRSDELKEVCFFGYNNNVKTIGWTIYAGNNTEYELRQNEIFGRMSFEELVASIVGLVFTLLFLFAFSKTFEDEILYMSKEQSINPNNPDVSLQHFGCCSDKKVG